MRADPQKVRAALRAALGASASSAEIAGGGGGEDPDEAEAEAAARLLADASPARLGILALEIAAECMDSKPTPKGVDKSSPNVALAALKFAHEMRVALLAEMG